MKLPGDIKLMNLVSAVLALGVGAVLLIAIAGWAMRLPMFSIRTIDVGGEVARSSLATIRANAAPRLAGNFFSVDLDAARAAFEAVPWVREAVVRRVWPDRLAVTLQEHQPAAYWEAVGDGARNDARDDDRLVNTLGEVFQANAGDVENEDLPTLRGPEGSAATMLAAYRRLAPLFAPLSWRLSLLELTGRGSWRIETADGAELELGRGGDDELAERVNRFVRTLPQVSAQYGRAVTHADLRHNGAFALRMDGIETVAPSARTSGRNRGRHTQNR